MTIDYHLDVGTMIRNVSYCSARLLVCNFLMCEHICQFSVNVVATLPINVFGLSASMCVYEFLHVFCEYLLFNSDAKQREYNNNDEVDGDDDYSVGDDSIALAAMNEERIPVVFGILFDGTAIYAFALNSVSTPKKSKSYPIHLQPLDGKDRF